MQFLFKMSVRTNQDATLPLERPCQKGLASLLATVTDLHCASWLRHTTSLGRVHYATMRIADRGAPRRTGSLSLTSSPSTLSTRELKHYTHSSSDLCSSESELHNCTPATVTACSKDVGVLLFSLLYFSAISIFSKAIPLNGKTYFLKSHPSF